MRKIYIGGKPFSVTVVKEDADMKEGLSGKKSLDKGHGMLFDFGEPQRVTMNMYKMVFPLDMLFIDADNKVIKVYPIEPGENDITVDGVRYVLEVNKGEGTGLLDAKASTKPNEGNLLVEAKTVPEKMQIGGTFQMYEESVKADPTGMHVLDDKGKILMNIKGGERIFSIQHTEDLMRLAKEVKAGAVDPEALGRYMEKVIKIQDTQAPEYV